LREDVFLVDVANADPADLARSARVTASSCVGDELRPENVTSGVSRPRRGAANLWAGAPGGAAGQWLMLSWDAPRPVCEVRLTFDTNLEPNFSFSIFPYVEHRVRAPVPETIAAYRIEAREGGARRTVAREAGNYQRHRIHSFAPVHTDAVRIVCEATNGADQARIYEVRAY
jgi:hypothetical protein